MYAQGNMLVLDMVAFAGFFVKKVESSSNYEMRSVISGRNLKLIGILLFFSQDIPGLFRILFCAQLKVHTDLKRAPTHH